MTDSSLRAALDVFRVLETGDVALARSAVSAAFRNREAAVAPPACAFPGPAGLLASSAWMRYAFRDLRFPISDAGVDGGTAWIRLRMQGVQARPFAQFHEARVARVLPATGRSVDFEQIHLLRVDDGVVTSHVAVRDDLRMLEQLGAFPPRPAMVLAMVKNRFTGSDRRAADEVARIAAAAAAAA